MLAHRHTGNTLLRLSACVLCALFSLSATATDDSYAAKRRYNQHRAGKNKVDKGSGETTAERDRRLSRECKGMPNAGACLGYTR